MDVLSPKHLAWASAVFPVLAFGFALNGILAQDIPDWAKPPEDLVIPLPPPYYLPLDVPVRAGLDGGKTLIAVSLAFSARLDPMDLLTVSALVTEKQATILADLTEVLLQTASENADPVVLYRDLPARLRDATNRALATDALPAPVHQVFIVDMMIQPN